MQTTPWEYKWFFLDTRESIAYALLYRVVVPIQATIHRNGLEGHYMKVPLRIQALIRVSMRGRHCPRCGTNLPPTARPEEASRL